MLTPGWYLPNIDWFAQLHTAPRPADEAQAVLDQLDLLFRDEPAFSPAQTITATYVILLGSEHLGGTMTHHARRHDLTELIRTLSGLNLAVAHLTQIVQRIAGHAGNRRFPGMDQTPGEAVQALVDQLSTAGASGELFAGHLKEAHLILRSLTT